MADNVTFQTTVATPPNATVVRTKDRDGVETQITALDLNPGGASEVLMTTTRTDGLMPAAIDDLNISIKNLIAVIANPPTKDAFDRVQVFVNGGLLNVTGTLAGVTTVTGLTGITNPVFPGLVGCSQPFHEFQPLSQIAWANSVRDKIT
jgi:hypothetical protein